LHEGRHAPGASAGLPATLSEKFRTAYQGA